MNQMLDEISAPLAAFWHVCCYRSVKNRQPSNAKSNFASHTTLSPFHSSVEPGTPITDYVARIMTACKTEAHGVLAALILVGRYCAVTKTDCCTLTAHRLCVTAMSLATKAHHDVRCSTRRFATAGGLSCKELGNLEWVMARGLGFNLFIRPEEWSRLIDQSRVVMHALLSREMLRRFSRGEDLSRLIAEAARGGVDLVACLDSQLESDDAEDARVATLGSQAMGLAPRAASPAAETPFLTSPPPPLVSKRLPHSDAASPASRAAQPSRDATTETPSPGAVSSSTPGLFILDTDATESSNSFSDRP